MALRSWPVGLRHARVKDREMFVGLIRSHIGEVYGRGYMAFNAVLAEWREKGDLEGLVLSR